MGWTVGHFRFFLILSALLVMGAMSAPAWHVLAQNSDNSMPLDSGFGPLDPSQPVDTTPQQIIALFAAKESAFRRALDDYTYRRTVQVDTLDDDGRPDGEYLEVDDVIFTPDGHRVEKVVYAPANTLTRIRMGPADFSDIEHRLPFVLTQREIGQYNVTYVGRQRVDTVDTYVFDVAPKTMEKGKRYFQGRIWVDQRDHQIVVTNGKNVPDTKRAGEEDLSPPFITFRQQIDGKYWFPVYTKAQGVLHYQGGKGALPQDVLVREIVKYAEYKRFGSSIRIIYQGQELPGSNQPNNVTAPANAPAAATQPGAVPPATTKTETPHP